MKIIDGKNAVLGRLASYAAKVALKGEEIIILNCEQIIITGNKRKIKEAYKEKRKKIGSGQQGPKYSRLSERIVKRAIRGMLPNFRKGRGKEVYKKIRCYVGVPKEYEDKKKIISGKEKKTKFIRVQDLKK